MKRNKTRRQLFLNKLSLIFSLALFSFQVFADWNSDLSVIEDALSQIQPTLASGDYAPHKIMPLAPNNSWEYSFTSNTQSGVSMQDVSATMGLLAPLGNICLRPIEFSNNQLRLYFGNYGDRVVLYRLDTIIENTSLSFSFHRGGALGADDGVVLASSSLSLAELSEDVKGTQTQEVNGSKVILEWRLSPRNVGLETNSNTYDGVIATQNESLSSASEYQIEFFMYLSPCNQAGGCFIAGAKFKFHPSIGLSHIQIYGDNDSLGGLFDHSYQLKPSPDSSFNLEAAQTLSSFESCGLGQEDTVSRASVGIQGIWINIGLGIVVLLRVYVFRPNRWLVSKGKNLS